MTTGRNDRSIYGLLLRTLVSEKSDWYRPQSGWLQADIFLPDMRWNHTRSTPQATVANDLVLVSDMAGDWSHRK